MGEDEVSKYILYLRNKTRRYGHPLSLHTINTWVRAIRAFFHWLAEAGYTENHLLAHLKEADAHLEERYVKVLGKGNKERLVPMGASCQRSMLHYYYHFRPERADPGAP